MVCLWLLAVNEGPSVAAKRPQYHGVMNALSTIGRQEGVRGLYRGVTPNVWGAGASWGLYFLLWVDYIALYGGALVGITLFDFPPVLDLRWKHPPPPPQLLISATIFSKQASSKGSWTEGRLMTKQCWVQDSTCWQLQKPVCRTCVLIALLV